MMGSESGIREDGETPDGATLASVAAEIATRDEMDMNRPISPLKPADDATIVDTTGLGIDEVVELIVETLRTRWDAS